MVKHQCKKSLEMGLSFLRSQLMSQRCTSKAPDVLSEVPASRSSNFRQDLQALRGLPQCCFVYSHYNNMPDTAESDLSSVYALALRKLCVFNSFHYLHLRIMPRHHSADNNLGNHCTTALIYKGQDLVLSVHRTSNCSTNLDRLSWTSDGTINLGKHCSSN